jgi:hypothetical protein
LQDDAVVYIPQLNVFVPEQFAEVNWHPGQRVPPQLALPHEAQV